MSGNHLRFIKSYPALMETPIWANDAVFKLYHYLLYRAAHENTVWQGIPLRKNELVISRQTASAQLHWSIHKYQRQLRTLQELGIVTARSSSRGTIITILDDGSAAAGDQTAPMNDTGIVTTQEQAEGSSGTEAFWPPGRHGSFAGAVTSPFPGCSGPPAGAAEAPVKEYRERNTMHTRSALQMGPEGFDKLWLAYPVEKRTQREKAAEIFQAALAQGATIRAFLDALEDSKRSPGWLSHGGRYVPGIVNWLQREAWRDYVKNGEREAEEEWTESW